MAMTSYADLLPEDGFKWLKYGQKYCQSESSTRLYFRCRENKDSNCPAKKIVDIVSAKKATSAKKTQYIENHNHPALSNEVPKPRLYDVDANSISSEQRGCDVESPSCSSKATCKDMEEEGKETEAVLSDEDQQSLSTYGAFTKKESSDGHSWLKYGQKNLYGNVFARTYYRCRMHKSLKCPAKKTVDTINNKMIQGERSFYRGQHNHPARWDPDSPNGWKVKANASNEVGVKARSRSQEVSSRSKGGKAASEAEGMAAHASEALEQQLRDQYLRSILETLKQSPKDQAGGLSAIQLAYLQMATAIGSAPAVPTPVPTAHFQGSSSLPDRLPAELPSLASLLSSLVPFGAKVNSGACGLPSKPPLSMEVPSLQSPAVVSALQALVSALKTVEQESSCGARKALEAACGRAQAPPGSMHSLLESPAPEGLNLELTLGTTYSKPA